MINAKAEELKKLITVPDFKEESYQHLSLSELSFLHNTSAELKIKNMANPQNAKFFKVREDFFMQLCQRRLQKINELYVLMSQPTSLPYIVCDPETSNDQVWLFDSESAANLVANDESASRGFQINAAKIENDKFLPFYTSLFFLGVNELLFNRGKEAFALQLDEFINKPDFASISTDSKPVVLNPELVLTTAYFAQGKAGAQEKQNNEELRDLEEEMIVNLLRGKVFVPVQMLEGQTEMKPENMRFPLIKLSNGKMFQPVCSDNNELARFSVGQERIRGLVIEGKNIKNVLVKEADGVLLNPKTVKLAIPKMKL